MTKDQIIDEYIRQDKRDGDDKADDEVMRAHMHALVELASGFLARRGLPMPDTYNGLKDIIFPIILEDLEPQGYALIQNATKRILERHLYDDTPYDELEPGARAAMEDFFSASMAFFASRGLPMPDTYDGCCRGILDVMDEEGYSDLLLHSMRHQIRKIKAGALH